MGNCRLLVVKLVHNFCKFGCFRLKCQVGVLCEELLDFDGFLVLDKDLTQSVSWHCVHLCDGLKQVVVSLLATNQLLGQQA
jgi:hypothetical protein